MRRAYRGSGIGDTTRDHIQELHYRGFETADDGGDHSGRHDTGRSWQVLLATTSNALEPSSIEMTGTL